MSTPNPDQRFVIVRHRPHARLLLVAALALWLGTLAAAWVLATNRAAPGMEKVENDLRLASRRASDADELVNQLRQNVATLRRSDQISRAANTELQASLAEREEEVSGLRADVAFYERLVGATGQRRGLTVHEALFAPEAGGTWRYTVTLTQNLNRGAISKGEARIAVEGVIGGQLKTLSWDDLLQKPGSPGQPFSFRYFQQLEGSVVLPAGFTPQRVRVQLRADGSTVDQAFPWQADTPAETKNMFGNGDRKSPRGGQAVETLIGPHAVIRGDIAFSGGLYVEGAIHGRVIADDGAPAVLTIADNGVIEGEVRAPVVIINGRMNGDVHAAERIELAANARVSGNIHYKVVEMAAGAMITGRLIHADTPLAQLAPPELSVVAEQAGLPAPRGKSRAEVA